MQDGSLRRGQILESVQLQSMQDYCIQPTLAGEWSADTGMEAIWA